MKIEIPWSLGSRSFVSSPISTIENVNALFGGLVICRFLDQKFWSSDEHKGEGRGMRERTDQYYLHYLAVVWINDDSKSIIR